MRTINYRMDMPEETRYLQPATDPSDIVALTVAAVKKVMDEQQPALSLGPFDLLSTYAVIASNLADIIQKELSEGAGFPGVWTYEVMQPFGEYLANFVGCSVLDESKVLSKLGELAYKMFLEAGFFDEEEQVAIQKVIKQVTGYEST